MHNKSLLFIFFFLIPNIMFAAADPIIEVENYLNSITTFSADFKQYSSDGTIKEGKFLLSKPGKMKWEYLKPKKAVVISNGKNIVYYDYELEEASYLSTKAVLAHFLSKEKINLAKDVHVEKYTAGKHYSELVISEKNKDYEKSAIAGLALKFEREDNHKMKLAEVDVFDENGQEIEIIFSNIKTNTEINKSEFIFRNPNFFSGS